jgi:hypothetical protein
MSRLYKSFYKDNTSALTVQNHVFLNSNITYIKPSEQYFRNDFYAVHRYNNKITQVFPQAIVRTLYD